MVEDRWMYRQRWRSEEKPAVQTFSSPLSDQTNTTNVLMMLENTIKHTFDSNAIVRTRFKLAIFKTN